MDKRASILVSGIVQGVFFRAHVRVWAEELELKGWVKNLPDGRVELVAEGPEEKLRKLVENIKKGPPSSHVEDVEVRWEEAKKEFKSFEVRF